MTDNDLNERVGWFWSGELSNCLFPCLELTGVRERIFS
jgi:hypothetical protein